MSSKEAKQAMAGWVAAIADNVKNPIAAIGAVLDRVEANLHDSAMVGTSIAQIRKRLADLNEYVSELSEFARPAVIRPAAAKTKTIVINAIQAAGLPSNCTVDVDVPADMMLRVDPSRMELVVKALLLNGFEAVDASRLPRLRIGARSLASGEASITVEDNGPGLPTADVPAALEPFFTTKEAGTGLGLSVARKYIEAHGGTITFDRSSALGGCRVQLLLPGNARLSESQQL